MVKKSALLMHSFVLLSTSSFLIACDSDDNPVEEVKDTVNETSQRVQMKGRWNGPCSRSDLFSMAIRKSYEFESEKNQFMEVHTLYSDDQCAQVAAQVKYNGEFEVERIAGADEIRNLNLHYQNMVVKINNRTTAELFDAVHFCGQDSWEAGSDVVIADSNGENCFISKVPTSKYGVVSVEDGKLYLSDELSSSPEERPQNVDHGIEYND